jgi:hypothetical protein
MILNWTWHSVIISIQFILKYLILFLLSIDSSSSSSILTSSFSYMVTSLSCYPNIFLPSLVCLFLSQPLLYLPVGVVLFDMAQCTNTAKGSPTQTMASKDHRGCWRGVTVIGSLHLSRRCHRDILKLRPKVLSIPGFAWSITDD